MKGTQQLVASALYGSGLRLMDALQPRLKDLALERPDGDHVVLHCHQ